MEFEVWIKSVHIANEAWQKRWISTDGAGALNIAKQYKREGFSVRIELI